MKGGESHPHERLRRAPITGAFSIKDTKDTRERPPPLTDTRPDTPEKATHAEEAYSKF